MYKRLLKPINTYSFFLFGPRGAGKSTFLKEFFKTKKTLWFNLLDPELEDRLARTPNQLKNEILAQKKEPEWVIIDEIQKVPKLLNIVHELIESTEIKFALTGSSARKLKKESANLLAGRAFVNHLFPLTHLEMNKDFNLATALQWGTLPQLTHFQTDEEREAYLKSYALTYLKEEIWAEHIIKNLDPFRRFLGIAAAANTEIINYTNISKDVGVSDKTCISYFEILEDTLMGFFLQPYHTSIRKQQRQSPKFYFFDIGLTRALSQTLKQRITPKTYGYGKSFEHFIITEIHRLNITLNKDYKLYYLRTKDQAEIDLIIETPKNQTYLIEIKSTTEITETNNKILSHFADDFPNATLLLISQDQTPQKLNQTQALHWQNALTLLFNP